MDKDFAARLMSATLALDKGIGDLDGLVSELEDGAEKKELIKALGDVLGILTKEFVFRIARIYPELDPDR